MNISEIKTIDEVILALEKIILESEENNQTNGYFAVLYKKVTVKVKEGIANNQFEDSARMEILDVTFAKRYLEAYFNHQNNQTVTVSWQQAFEISTDYWPIVLQHLLMGMNAHINLDLGIAAAEVAKNKNLPDLQNDFNKINEILSSLVHEVQDDLSSVWPALKYILKWSGKIDDFLVDFSMKLARDGAWKFATELAEMEENEFAAAIEKRDRKVAAKTNIILRPGLIASVVLKIIRISEFGSIQNKIRKMKD